MAHRTTFEAERPTKSKVRKSPSEAAAPSERERVFEAFRRWGYLEASLDPLGFFEPLASPDLDFSGPDADAARRIYSGTIGADFMHLLEPERRRWIAERMESAAPETDRHMILSRLVRADLFEQVLLDSRAQIKLGGQHRNADQRERDREQLPADVELHGSSSGDSPSPVAAA